MFRLLLIGWITVMSSVSGADVMIDENDGIHMNGNQIKLEVEAGRHLIMVDKKGYRPYIDTITILPNQNRQVPVQMVSLSQPRSKYFSIRWGGVGAGIGTGIDIHVSLFDMRFGWFTLEPCTWGINAPIFVDVSHATTPWKVHYNRRSKGTQYEVAVPSHELQIYYTPMVGVQIPVGNDVALSLGAGPQVSWTNIKWETQWEDNPFTHVYTFTTEPFPKRSWQFDPVWFSIQLGILFRGEKSDLLTYLKYQDGYFLGVEARF